MAQLAVVSRAGVTVPEPEQATLFDLGVDLQRLRSEAQILDRQRLADNTRASYEQAWRRFTAWCAAAGRSPMPASPETLELWAVHLLSDGCACSTVRCWLSGVAHHHRLAGHSIDRWRAWGILRVTKRKGRGLPKPRRALNLEHLERLSRALLAGTLSDRDVRDRALLLLGFAGGFRRSELVGLDVDDVEQAAEGLVITLRRSKTDQEYQGRVVGVRTGSRVLLCPVRAMRLWLHRRGFSPGPLFCAAVPPFGVIDPTQRLSGKRVPNLLKDALRRAGFTPVELERISAHSLRAGFVTTARRAGASHSAIMASTGHRSVAMVERYVRPSTAFDFDPLRGVL